MKDDDLPPDQPEGATAALGLRDFLEVARIYGGLAYLGSIRGSPAERARLRRGDVVLSVNGISTPDIVAFVHARAQRNGSATVRFVRDGVEREVDLVWDVARPSNADVN
jgi:S1-C subfamily serine protease